MPVLDDLLLDPYCDPRTLAVALDDSSGAEWRDWLPETLKQWYPVEPAGANHDKVLAIQVVRTNPDVWEEWTLFMAVAAAFSHRTPRFDFLEPVTTAEAAWACTCMKSLAQGTFSDSTRRFLLALAYEDGLYVFPWAELDLTKEPVLKGFVPQDEEAQDIARRVASTFASTTDVPPEFITYDRKDTVESMLERLFSIRAYIIDKARP